MTSWTPPTANQPTAGPHPQLVSMNPDVASLRLYDIANTPGVAADLSHINTDAEVAAFTGPDELAGVRPPPLPHPPVPPRDGA